MTLTDGTRLTPETQNGTRILVTGIGGPAGRGLLRQLLDRRLAVVGVDALPVDIPEVPTRVVPLASDPEFLPQLRGLVNHFDVDMVVPTVSEELPILADAQETIAARVVIGSAAAVRTADDKFLTARCLSAHGIDVPMTSLASAFVDARAAADVVGLPFVLKPRVSRGSRGVQVVRDAVRSDWKEFSGTHVVQEFAPAAEYCVAVFAPGSVSGPAVAVSMRKTGLTQGVVGNATDVQRVEAADDRVAATARAAVDALGLVGPADVDVRCRRDGTPLVLEINARFGAHHHVVPEIVDALLADTSSTARRPWRG